MKNENFSKNLRTLCNNQISVAHVCRKMEINRQQFNKYLSGQIYPSKYNLNKICQYFQFSEEELNLESSQFLKITSTILQSESNSEMNVFEKHLNLIPSNCLLYTSPSPRDA